MALYRHRYAGLAPDSTEDLDLLERVQPFSLNMITSASSTSGNGLSDSSNHQQSSDEVNTETATNDAILGVPDRKKTRKDRIPHFLRPFAKASRTVALRKDVDILLQELRQPLPPPPRPVVR